MVLRMPPLHLILTPLVAQLPTVSAESLITFILCAAACAFLLKTVLDMWKAHFSHAPQKPDPDSIKSQFDALDRRLSEVEASDTRWRDSLDERMRNMETSSARHTALLETVLMRLDRHNS